MKNKSIIRRVTHPEPWQTYRARQDEAVVTNRAFVEKPWWFENTETGQLYYEIYACIGWPTPVTDQGLGIPGYVAMIGVVRPSKTIEHISPIDADFQLIEEAESLDVNTLIDHCVELRQKYGFKDSFTGDPEKFITTLALKNEEILRQGSREPISITPPVEFYDTNNFEIYVRALRACIQFGKKRFFLGSNNILKTRIQEFRANDPAVMATGGMLHTLLNTVLWMNSAEDNNVYILREE